MIWLQKPIPRSETSVSSGKCGWKRHYNNVLGCAYRAPLVGFLTDFILVRPASAIACKVAMAQTLVEQFKDIGVKINIKTLPNVQYWDWAIGALCI
jgi:ABC-type transport system substrate-binding protein